MDEAITTIEIRQNSVNHRVLHSPLIVHKERTQNDRRFSGNPMLTCRFTPFSSIITTCIHSK